jgi:hypothetical protein
MSILVTVRKGRGITGRRGWVAVCYSHKHVHTWFVAHAPVLSYIRRFIGWQPLPPAEFRVRQALRYHLDTQHAHELED